MLALAVKKSLLEAEAALQGHDLTPWCFVNHAGKPVDAMNFLHRVWAPLLAKAGLRKIRFHDLRHTFATHSLAAGAPITYVSAQLGHAKPSMTLSTYAHWIPASDGRRHVRALELHPRRGPVEFTGPRPTRGSRARSTRGNVDPRTPV
jgi:integrase